jgi:Tfp pilus assembly protein PilW
MIVSKKRSTLGFTLSEMMISVAVGCMAIGATTSASVALQKSFAAANDFFYTHLQQIRIIDYLSRDVKRSTVVITSADKQTVTCTIPNLIIKAGDPDAGLGVGKRRTPTVTVTSNGAVVNYGTTTSTASYSVSGQAIVRTENGVVTTIAASTDQLVPQTLDTELANTEYADCNVTFLPIFNFNPAANPSPSATPDPTLLDKRNGTAIYARAYLRNKRRG